MASQLIYLSIWNLQSADTQQFDPSKKDFIINYRIENLEALVEELKKAGITTLDKFTDSENGKFVHILDSEGNSIELFEPAA